MRRLNLTGRVFIKCVGHVTSNALKHGLSAVLEEGMNDEVAMAIRSLRNSSEEFFKIIDKFLCHRMRFHSKTDDSHRAEFWKALGVDEEILVELLVVDPRWDVGNQVLHVSSALQDDPDCMNRVSSLLTYFIRWKEFSATRWAGVGPSHRHLLASLATGIDYMVPLIYDTANTSTYYLTKFKELTTEGRFYVAVGSMMSYPVEWFSAQMLEDDKIAYLESISMDTWDAIAELVDGKLCNGFNLKHTVFRSVHTSMA